MKRVPRRYLFKKGCMGAVCLAMALCLLPAQVTASAPVSTAQADTKEGLKAPMISAYVYDRDGLVFREEDAQYLTQMNYSFALIKDGKVTGSHWQSIAAFEKFMQRHPHILPVMAVGGWGADGFSQAAKSESSRRTFVDSAVALMQEHGFLGLDIDWEYPGSSVAGIESNEYDADNLLLLLKELRSALNDLTSKDGAKRYISIAVGGSKQYADRLDCISIGELVDQVNVMTYDLRGFDKVTGHHTCLYPQAGDADDISASTAVEAFHQAGILKEKLMMGAAFYGRAWRDVKNADHNGLGQEAGTSGNKSYGYPEIKKLMEAGKFTRYWDEKAMAPYLFDGSTFLSFEDTQSIAAKGEYARDNGLMGVMFWEYGLDTTGELLKSLYDSMHE